jgi:predicted DNA-binding antitoxin AbrB/MazE fold protein
VAAAGIAARRCGYTGTVTETAEAIYEGGVLRPLCDLHLREGEHVTLTVEREDRARLTPEEMLELLGSVYDGLTKEEIAEVESHFKRPLDMFADLE